MKPVEKSFQRENCTNCQACVQKCPVNAISRETLEISLEKCIGCMRCVRVCKAKARDFDASQVRQYLESNYSEPREIEYF
ncbi:4Fe-4S binding protein [Blautia sp.]|uniref:4Fe-4S binding protein n=1 Tax=Blautia sp. TaxID=1955243 RepID=UPI0026100B0F|nr:4Fe-4S binding protein [Blautia sp.]